MKQEPILPSINVLDMPVPSSRMVPKLTKIGSGRLVGDGLVAVLWHGFCLLIAFWCMDIPKHDNPLHSTIEVAYEVPEALPIPEEAASLPDTFQNEPQAPEPEQPSVSEPFPQTDSIAPLAVIKSQPVIKEKILTHSQSSEHTETNEDSHPAASQTAQSATQPSTMTIHSTQPASKALTAAQRCSGLSKDYPMAARRRHEEGVVKVGYRLLPDGQVQQVEVIESSGFSDLDHAAVSAVQAIKCKAVAGQPVIQTSVPVNFSLNKKN